MLAKILKIHKKLKINYFEKIKKKAGDMVKRHTDTKFDAESSDGLGCSPCDGRTTTTTTTTTDRRQTPDKGDLKISASDN